jgi:hypothetical protein
MWNCIFCNGELERMRNDFMQSFICVNCVPSLNMKYMDEMSKYYIRVKDGILFYESVFVGRFGVSQNYSSCKTYFKELGDDMFDYNGDNMKAEYYYNLIHTTDLLDLDLKILTDDKIKLLLTYS